MVFNFALTIGSFVLFAQVCSLVRTLTEEVVTEFQLQFIHLVVKEKTTTVNYLRTSLVVTVVRNLMVAESAVINCTVGLGVETGRQVIIREIKFDLVDNQVD